MKKFILFVTVALIGFTFAHSSYAGSTAKKEPKQQVAQDTTGWKRAQTWTAMSDGRKLIYKLNPANQVVLASWNGKTWSAVIGGTWVDKNGNWLKVQNKKLVTSSDKGVTWVAVANGQWQDADGDWCMFTAQWALMIKKSVQ